MPKYVAHICKNKECQAIWLDIDLTNVKTFPPSWKYCRECCKKMGIDFDKQKPADGRIENIEKE